MQSQALLFALQFIRDLALNGGSLDYNTAQNVLMPSDIAIVGLYVGLLM